MSVFRKWLNDIAVSVRTARRKASRLSYAT
jgi:hypothetical protein